MYGLGGWRKRRRLEELYCRYGVCVGEKGEGLRHVGKLAVEGGCI